MIFHEYRLLADDSHETSYLIFSKIKKMLQNLSSAAVVIGALRVNLGTLDQVNLTNSRQYISLITLSLLTLKAPRKKCI